MINSEIVESVGMVAGTLTTLAFLPQVIKTWRTQATDDLSLAMFVSFFIGVLLWLAYGVMTDAWPIILANAVTAVFAGYILTVKIRHALRNRAMHHP